MSVTINGTNGLTFSDASTQNTAATGFGFKNRIINGAMMIDQRNAGASVSADTGGQYFVDRWCTSISAASKFTAQQSSAAPTGFTKSLLITSSTAWTVGATDYATLNQFIEGVNAADFGWGAVGALTVTLSFWVRSSLTGTFGGVITNATNATSATRSHPFSYTISSANTWEQKTISIAGDTTGTWGVSTSGGVSVQFSLAAGSSKVATAGSWTGSPAYYGATGQTNILATNGATFYITGVQLEKGSTATSFDYRPYGTELALCQRYYYKMFPAEADACLSDSGYATSTTAARFIVRFPQTFRTKPTALEQSGTAGDYTIRYQGSATACSVVPTFLASGVVSTTSYTAFAGTIASSLTAGDSVVLTTSNATGYLGWSAEL